MLTATTTSTSPPRREQGEESVRIAGDYVTSNNARAIDRDSRGRAGPKRFEKGGEDDHMPRPSSTGKIYCVVMPSRDRAGRRAQRGHARHGMASALASASHPPLEFSIRFIPPGRPGGPRHHAPPPPIRSPPHFLLHSTSLSRLSFART